MNAPDIAQLIQTLDSFDYEERAQAQNQLTACGSAAVEPLIAAVRQLKGRKCWLALHVLTDIDDERVVPVMIEALRLPHNIVQQTAAEMLSHLGDQRAVQPLIESLGSSSANLVLWAATALGELGDPSAIDPLILTLQTTPSPTVRHTVIKALQKLNARRALPIIAQFAQDTDDHVRSRVQKALAALSALPEE